MRAFLTSALLTVALICMTACGSLERSTAASEVAVKYATLTMLQNSTSVTAADVLDHTAQLRSIADPNMLIDVNKLAEHVFDGIDLGKLSPADAFLLMAIVDAAADRLEDVTIPESERVTRFFTVLEWVEDAALLYLASV